VEQLIPYPVEVVVAIAYFQEGKRDGLIRFRRFYVFTRPPSDDSQGSSGQFRNDFVGILDIIQGIDKYSTSNATGDSQIARNGLIAIHSTASQRHLK